MMVLNYTTILSGFALIVTVLVLIVGIAFFSHGERKWPWLEVDYISYSNIKTKSCQQKPRTQQYLIMFFFFFFFST